MGTAQRLEEELRRGLEELAAAVAAERRAQAPAQEVEQRLDRFEIAWEERLAQERAAAVRGVHVALKEQAAAGERAARMASNLEDAAAYRGLDAETRDRMWNATDRSNEPRPETAAARERRRATFDAAQAVIHAHADRLQDAVREATDELRQGRPLSLSGLLEAQRAREAAADRSSARTMEPEFR